jgi:hypothetical protein
MTMVTYDDLICECGHTGKLRTRENDAPFSSNWMSHRLEGFEGHVGDEWDLSPVRCPACGQTGKVDFKKKGVS